MQTSTAMLPTPDGEMGLYDAVPDSAPRGAVVVVQEAFGVGFCMGGAVAFLAAARRPVGAAVTFYGGGVTEGRFGMPPLVELAAELQAPWLGLYGALDQSIPVEQVEQLRAATAAVSSPTELVLYDQAGHGFHCDQRPESYHQQSAADAWERTLAWLGQHLPG